MCLGFTIFSIFYLFEVFDIKNFKRFLTKGKMRKSWEKEILHELKKLKEDLKIMKKEKVKNLL